MTILDSSLNKWFIDGKGNISVTAPNYINFTAGANLNISVGHNMTTSVGANQSDSIGMNKSTNVTMNNSQSVGMLNMLSVGTDFINNVVGKMTEFITGNKERYTEKDRTRVAKGKINTQSEGMYEQHEYLSGVKNSIVPYGIKYYPAWLSIFPNTNTREFAHGSNMNASGIDLDLQFDEIDAIISDVAEIILQSINPFCKNFAT